MAYDQGLAQRLRESLSQTDHVEEKQMFGGLAFMVRGNMCVGIVDDKLMVRVHPEDQDELLQKYHTQPMDFTGKPMKGFLYITPKGIAEDEELQFWLDTALDYNQILPAK